jgi:hypothetical protein
MHATSRVYGSEMVTVVRARVSGDLEYGDVHPCEMNFGLLIEPLGY